jgi:hypothetical protein
MQPYNKTTLSLVIKPKGDPIYSEMATVVGMRDDGSGPYVSISQCYDCKETGEIRLCEEEWPLIKEAIEQMLEECRIQNEEGEIQNTPLKH